MMTEISGIGFIGAGTVARVLAAGLAGSGYRVAAVSSRSLASARRLAGSLSACDAYSENQAVADNADIAFITTPDDAIAPVAARVRWRQGQSVVHCSGADSADILGPARSAGALTGVLHPLQTFASPGQQILPGTTFALEAEEPLLAVLKKMATGLGGRWIELEAGDRVIYHAAAVFACNYLVTLVKLSADLWRSFAVPVEQATAALLPLLRGTINNIDVLGIPGALTGPIARGDSGTILKHLDALNKMAPEMVATYRELGLKTIPVALDKGGINETQADRLKAILALNGGADENNA
jgi:predicted short-subunit dehydrogenase-like oxidoreductase (DUF2520 family)